MQTGCSSGDLSSERSAYNLTFQTGAGKQKMLLPVLLGLAGLVFLVLLPMIAYGSWIAHKMTLMERVSLDGHPSRLGLNCEDVDFLSRGDEVPLSGWYLPAGQDDRCVILIQGHSPP